jgi:hypothetical protein
MNEWKNGGKTIAKESRSTREKPVPVQIFSSKDLNVLP